MNYFELDPLFAVLLNLMTNQSYAQFTIACNTVESPILHKLLVQKLSILLKKWILCCLFRVPRNFEIMKCSRNKRRFLPTKRHLFLNYFHQPAIKLIRQFS